MKFFSFLLTLLILCFIERIKCVNLDEKGLLDLLQELSANNMVNSNRKVVFFLINQKKKKLDHDRYMNYLIEFLKTTGVKCDMYNVKNRHFIAITNIDNYIDKQEILIRFKNIILDIVEGSAYDFFNELTGNKPDL